MVNKKLKSERNIKPERERERERERAKIAVSHKYRIFAPL